MRVIELSVNGRVVSVEVRRKRVKNLNLRVRKDGSVVLSMPPRTTRLQAREMLERHRGWLAKRLERIERAGAPQPLAERDHVVLWGKRVELFVEDEPGRTRTTCALQPDGTLCVRVPAAAGDAERSCDAERDAMVERAFERFCKREAKRATELLAPAHEKRLGVHASAWSFRRMVSRWGSCSPQTGRIRINTALVAYPARCLDYVIAHELTHLLEPSHGPRFHALLETTFPDEVAARAELRLPPGEQR